MYVCINSLWPLFCLVIFYVLSITNFIYAENPLIASILLKNHRVHLLQSLVEPVALAKVLNDEKVFTDGALSNIISTSGSAQRSEALLATVKDSVMRDYKALETFAAVLRISPCKENNILGVKLLNDYSELLCLLWGCTCTYSVCTCACI